MIQIAQSARCVDDFGPPNMTIILLHKVPKTHFSRCHPVDQGVSLLDGADGDLSTFQTPATVAAVQSLHLRRDNDQSVAACHHLIGYRVRRAQAVSPPPPKKTNAGMEALPWW